MNGGSTVVWRDYGRDEGYGRHEVSIVLVPWRNVSEERITVVWRDTVVWWDTVVWRDTVVLGYCSIIGVM